jgi:hypothetical protein
MKNEAWIFVVVLVIVLFFILSGLGYGGYGGMMGMMYGGFGSGLMIFGWLYGILVIVALVLLIVWLFRQVQK